MKPILIMKTGSAQSVVTDEAGDFEHWIMRGMDFPATSFLTVDVFRGTLLPVPSEVAGVVITGSPAIVTDREPWCEYSASYLRDAADCGLPILGICFGHQLLAYALGGVVDFHPNGREIGTTRVSCLPLACSDPLFQDIPGQFDAHVSHLQTIITLPDGSGILASNGFEQHHAVRFGNRVWGVQFHPEFDEQIMRAYITERSALLDRERMDPYLLMAGVRPTEEAARVLRNFAEIIGDDEAQ